VKLVKKVNCRVVISGLRRGLELTHDQCLDIAEQVGRGLRRNTNISVPFYVAAEYDTRVVCSHCGEPWDVAVDDSNPQAPTGTPYCCRAALEEFLGITGGAR
jgi:hypothetical protein